MHRTCKLTWHDMRSWVWITSSEIRGGPLCRGEHLPEKKPPEDEVDNKERFALGGFTVGVLCIVHTEGDAVEDDDEHAYAIEPHMFNDVDHLLPQHVFARPATTRDFDILLPPLVSGNRGRRTSLSHKSLWGEWWFGWPPSSSTTALDALL